MSNYNVDNNINDKNDYLLEGNDEDNSINLFIENKGSLFNENDEEE